MAYLNRTTTNLRTRSNIIDNITPHLWVQDRVDRPHGPWRPAPWLPVQFVRGSAIRGDSAVVCSAGKVVAFDSQNFLVPAGLREKLKAGASALSYTSTDVAAKVTDLVTGEPVAAAVTYSTLQVALAILERGLITFQEATDAGATVPPTTNTHGEDYIDLFLSPSVGVLLNDMYVWGGKPEEIDQKGARDYALPKPADRGPKDLNFLEQTGVQFLTEVQMKLPHLVAGEQADDEFDFAALNTAGSETAAAGDQVTPGEFWNATNLAALTRYEAEVTASTPVVALGLDADGAGDQHPVARNTSRTPFTCDTDGILVRERNSISEVTREGDWYLDAGLGVLFLHSDTWATQVAAAATPSFSYFYYAQAAATAHKFAHFDDIAKPGGYVTFDAESNFRMATTAEIATGQNILGRLVNVIREPRGDLEKVKTAYDLGNMPKTGKTPGSATRGYSDLITLSDEVVADQVVVINLRAL